jgi:hypothetical protein
MATTTNFGWATPDDTDFVKDGAAAIRTLGSSIDTSLVDLKGGATGQVLSKTSATDMDFTWVTTDDADAIQNAIVDAKGDLIAASAADTPARLAVGANGETLVADSSTSTGLRYQGSQAAGKNAVINGGLDIWQRATSSTTNGYTTADRWYNAGGGGTTTFARESTIVPTGSTYSMKMTTSTTTNLDMNQAIETLNAIQFAGQKVTISYKAAASASVTVFTRLYYSTSTDVGPTGSWTQITADSGGSATVSTTASFSTVSGVYTVPSTTKSLLVVIGSTSLANGTSLYFGQAQLELGSVPTAFTRAGGTIQGELAACQRYYFRTSSSTNGVIGIGNANATTTAGILVNLPVSLRAIPSSTIDFSNLRLLRYGVGAQTLTAATLNTGVASLNSVLIDTTVASGLVADIVYTLGTTSSAGYLGISAEL